MKPKMFQPDYAVPPHEIMHEAIIEALGDSRSALLCSLSALMGCLPNEVSDVVAGRAPVTPDIAQGLARALGSSADQWMRLQVLYESDCARLGLTPHDKRKG